MSFAATLLVLYWLVVALGFRIEGSSWDTSLLWPLVMLLFAIGEIRDFLRARFWGRS